MSCLFISSLWGGSVNVGHCLVAHDCTHCRLCCRRYAHGWLWNGRWNGRWNGWCRSLWSCSQVGHASSDPVWKQCHPGLQPWWGGMYTCAVFPLPTGTSGPCAQHKQSLRICAVATTAFTGLCKPLCLTSSPFCFGLHCIWTWDVRVEVLWLMLGFSTVL